MVTNRGRKSFGSLPKIPKVGQKIDTLKVSDPLSGISGPTSHFQIYTNYGPNPLT